jgi:hypothetical protein
MPRWTDEDNAKLRSLAGTVPTREIAARLGRSVEATLVHASKLKLPLRMRRPAGGPVSPSTPAHSREGIET